MAVYRQIKTRSPFYVQLQTTQPVVQLNLRVWLGDVVTDKPTDATYVLEKETTDGATTFEIAELIRDYIKQTGDYSDGAVWAETSFTDFGAVTAESVTYLATEGYDTYREDMSHSGNSFITDYVMLPEDTDGNYRLTGAKGEISKFQVMVNSENNTDWSYTTFDTQGIASTLKPSNLITYSEDFTKWVGNGFSLLSNGVADPNQGNDAYSFSATTSGTFLRRPVGALESTIHTQSMYVKYNNADAEIEFNNTEFSTNNVFNITSSGVTAQTPNANRVIESVGNGWYRISIEFIVPSAAYVPLSSVELLIEEEQEGCYIFGVQLEAQESTTDYVKTESFPVEGLQDPAGNVLISSSSQGLIRTFKVDESVGRIELNLNGVTKIVYHDVFDCNKYNSVDNAFRVGYAKTSRPVVLSYVNKQGAKNTFAFTLKHTQEMQAKSSSYQRNLTDYTNLNRNKNLHSVKKVIGSTKQTFTINTDFINEYYVEQLEELLLSEYVWALNPLVDNEYVPVLITDKKVLKKNHLNDKLIQYTINYEVASNYMNTIR